MALHQLYSTHCSSCTFCIDLTHTSYFPRDSPTGGLGTLFTYLHVGHWLVHSATIRSSRANTLAASPEKKICPPAQLCSCGHEKRVKKKTYSFCPVISQSQLHVKESKMFNKTGHRDRRHQPGLSCKTRTWSPFLL
jgi:hypothetical protein